MNKAFSKITNQNKLAVLFIEVLLLAAGVAVLAGGYFAVSQEEVENGWATNDQVSNQAAATSTKEDLKPTSIAPTSLIPERLVVPSLAIDAPVIPVGKNRVGNMAVPDDYDTVAWYKPGFQPGEKGKAVLAGHLDNGLGRAGVFERLSELEIDDTFSVIGQSGKKMTFRVVEKNVYDYRKAPLEKVFGGSDKSSVNLITCGGTWLEELNTYKDRTVVTAEFVEMSEIEETSDTSDARQS